MNVRVHAGAYGSSFLCSEGMLCQCVSIILGL